METAAARVGRGENAIRRRVQRAIRKFMTDNRPHTEILTGPLEDENNKLKRIVADLSLDKAMLQDVLSKKL
jgi:hypothetical protein